MRKQMSNLVLFFFSNRNQENLIKLPEFIIVLLNFIQVEILTRNHNFKLEKKIVWRQKVS